MSSWDKGLLDSLFRFKELAKNLIHYVSELSDFLSSCNKGFLGFLLNLREFEKKIRLHGGFFFIYLVFQAVKIIKVCREEIF